MHTYLTDLSRGSQGGNDGINFPGIETFCFRRRPHWTHRGLTGTGQRDALKHVTPRNSMSGYILRLDISSSLRLVERFHSRRRKFTPRPLVSSENLSLNSSPSRHAISIADNHHGGISNRRESRVQRVWNYNKNQLHGQCRRQMWDSYSR